MSFANLEERCSIKKAPSKKFLPTRFYRAKKIIISRKLWSMGQRCGAAPDLSTEEPWNNSLTSMIDRFGESVPRYSRILGSQISVLTQLILPPELLQKIIENYFRGVGFEPMPSRMVFRRANRYTTTTLLLKCVYLSKDFLNYYITI